MASLIVVAGLASNRSGIAIPLDQSSPCRRLAAAAKGPITKLISDNAHRIENGAPNDSPVIAPCEAATPKISTGIDSGSTSTASNNPPRCMVTASAAPIMPGKGQRRRAGEQGQGDGRGRQRIEIEQQAEHRGCNDQRQSGGNPMRQRFRGAGEFQGSAAHHDQIERAILVIGHEQPIEREQACEQRAEPEDRRPEPRQKRQIGPDRERPSRRQR